MSALPAQLSSLQAYRTLLQLFASPQGPVFQQVAHQNCGSVELQRLHRGQADSQKHDRHAGQSWQLPDPRREGPWRAHAGSRVSIVAGQQSIGASL